MTDVQIRIIARAVKIRLNRGEQMDEIIASYTKLTGEDIEAVKAQITEV